MPRECMHDKQFAEGIFWRPGKGSMHHVCKAASPVSVSKKAACSAPCQNSQFSSARPLKKKSRH
eukprot:1147585-Pelagomonas_calceolata.AAC.5